MYRSIILYWFTDHFAFRVT